MRILSFDPAIKNLAFTLLNFTDEKIKIVCWKIINLQGDKKKMSAEDTINSLIERLNEINKDFDAVVIESQYQNNIIKSISIAIYAYYKALGLKVNFISPKLKLKEYTSENLCYSERKKLSITQCQSLLSCEEWQKIAGSRKKDDICDTILQAKYYYSKNAF